MTREYMSLEKQRLPIDPGTSSGTAVNWDLRHDKMRGS